VINKDLLSDAYLGRIDSLTDDDIDRLIEIADKLYGQAGPRSPRSCSCSNLTLVRHSELLRA
jgi:hypothetical protein